MKCEWSQALWMVLTCAGMLFAAAACDEDPATDDDDDDDSTPFVPQLATGGCGAPAYDWLSTERMGEIVEWEEQDGLTAAAIDMLLENYGIEVFSPVPYDVELYRVRYITQDRGVEVETTGFVSFPIVDEPTVVPTVAWLHGTTGFADACAPTALGLEGAAGNLILSSLGYAVTAPDYLGMNGWGEASTFVHPYVVAEPTAVASLDSIPAIHRFHGEVAGAWVDAEPSDQTILWGGSEGGFASFFADRYAPGYAPEFDVVADVSLVPPTDPLGLTTHGVTVFGPTTGALAAVLVAGNDWYGLQGSMDEVLTDEDPHYLASVLPGMMADGCDSGDAFDDITTVEEVYTPEFIAAAAIADWDAIEPWSCYLGQSTLHDSAIPHGNDTPTLYVISAEDTLVAADVVRDDFPVLCDQGYRLDYLECEGASHSEGAVQTLPYQWAWVERQLAGEGMDDPCVAKEPVDCSEFGVDL